MTVPDLAAYIAAHPTDQPPGTAYWYNNPGYFLLGLVVFLLLLFDFGDKFVRFCGAFRGGRIVFVEAAASAQFCFRFGAGFFVTRFRELFG